MELCIFFILYEMATFQKRQMARQCIQLKFKQFALAESTFQHTEGRQMKGQNPTLSVFSFSAPLNKRLKLTGGINLILPN